MVTKDYITMNGYEFHFHFVDYGTKAYSLGNYLIICNHTLGENEYSVQRAEQVSGLSYYYNKEQIKTYFDLDCSIVLDVGSNLSKGIIDNHYTEGAGKSALSLMRERPELWMHLLDKKAVNVILHLRPDFDCISSVFYLMTSLTQDSTGENSNEAENFDQISIIDKYCNLNDRGCLLYTRAYDKVPHNLVRFFTKCSSDKIPKGSFAKMVYRIERGCQLLATFCKHISREQWIRNSFRWENVDKNPLHIFAPLDYDAYVADITEEYQHEIEALEKDYVYYQEAVQKTEALSDNKPYLRVPILSAEGETGSRLVRAICFREPLKCELHKDYARADGYNLTFIPMKGFNKLPARSPLAEDEYFVERNTRVIISVAENSKLDLSRVAKYLELAEQRKEAEIIHRTMPGGDLEGKRLVTLSKGEKTTFKPRGGLKRFEEDWCSNSDPWYDGRFNNYTIIDAPSCGSLLTIEEVYQVMLNALSEELEQYSLRTLLPFTIGGVKAKDRRNLYDAYKKWLELVEVSNFHRDPTRQSEDYRLYSYINRFLFMEANSLKAERACHFTVDIEELTLAWDKNKVASLRLVEIGAKETSEERRLKLSIKCIVYRYGIGFLIIDYIPTKAPSEQRINVEELVELNQRLMSGKINTPKGVRFLSEIIMDSIVCCNIHKEETLRQIFQFGQPLTYNSLQFMDKSKKYSGCELGYKLSNGYLFEDPYNSECYHDNIGEDTLLEIAEIGQVYISKNGCTFIAREKVGDPNIDKKVEEFYKSHNDIDLSVFLLVLQQRYALLHFSEKLSEYTNKNTIWDKSAITKLRKSFLDFTTQGWFGQISGYEYLQTLFKKTKDVLEVDSLYSEVDQQIEMIDEYNQAQFNQLVQNISFFGIFFAIVNIVGGSNLFDLEEGGWSVTGWLGISNQWFVVLVSLLMSVLVMGYSLIKKRAKLK